MRDLPSGTVTFLFTDIEGSTKLLHELGAETYSATLADHRRVLRRAFTHHGGVEVDTQGDAFFVAFASVDGAVSAAQEARDALGEGPIRVRVAIHSGAAHLTAEGYVGENVHLGARIAGAGHGGQILLSAQTRQLLGNVLELTDHGEHRLKDFETPVWIYQLGTQRFPPLRTISNTNLPRPVSSFVGREKELADTCDLLRDGARLLTLTGPGGSGKTRLAIETAYQLLLDFRNGVFWLDLAPLRDSSLVAEAIGQTVGAKDGLTEHIGERQMLLVLDNLEQVIESAPSLSPLLTACPNLRMLVTSRELLRVGGEVEYPVPPLAVREAVELFCARSGLAPSDTIAELCRRLDNLPLAVELAAARASVLTPAQILGRLASRLDLLKGGRDADARQQTLRATIEWSHELLSDDEKALFARLAVFVGGFSLEAAEEVAGTELDVLESLIDKSLVRHTDDRFSMFESIGDFAAEQLERTGGANTIRRRHAEYFLAMAQDAEPHVLGLRPTEWLIRLDGDHANLRAALDHLEASGETQLALELGGSIWEFWCLRSHYAEGWRRLERLLELDDRPTMARAKALTGAAHLAPHVVGAEGAAHERPQEALALHRELGDAWGIAFAEFEVAGTFTDRGDFAAALPMAEQSVRRLRELGDEHRALQATRLLAWCNLEIGQIERAKELYGELLDGARSAGDTVMEARALSSFASFASEEGRHREALTLLEDAYRLDQEFADPDEIAVDLIRFARALALAHRPDAAAQLLSLAEAKHEELNATLPDYVIAYRDEGMTVARTQLDVARFAKAWEQGRKLTIDEAVALALGSLDSPDE